MNVAESVWSGWSPYIRDENTCKAGICIPISRFRILHARPLETNGVVP